MKSSLSVKCADNRIQKKNLSKYLVGWCMILPSFIMFVGLTVYPILWALRFVLYDYDGITKPVFVGLDNILRVITRDPIWWKSVLNTFKFAFFKLIVEIPLTLVLAAILRGNLKGKGFFRGLYFMPSVLSAAVITFVFTFILSPQNGFLNQILTKLGIISEPVNWLGTNSAFFWVVFMSIWQVFGHTCILLLSGMMNIPNDIYESASMDGATRVKQFWHMTLPMLAPVFKTILMLSITGSLGAFETIFILTGGGPNHATDVMAINIYNQFFAAGTRPAYGYGATLGVFSSIIIGIVTIIYRRVTAKIDKIYD